MTEIWKDIEGYEGLYQVSNLGRVKSLERVVSRSDGRTQKVSDKIRKSYLDDDGYPRLSLSREGAKKTVKIHRLVAQAFIYRKAGASEVNHLNGNKQDNSVSNLEWVTSEENIEHSFREGLHNSPKKSVSMLTLSGNHILTFPSAAEAARHLGKTTTGGITNVCKGRRKTVYGYMWKYASEGESL